MENIIISLGGSLVVPEEIDISFLKEFHDLIIRETKKGKRFFIIVGGGRVCRKYQKAASEVSKLDKEDIDWLGIHATRLNAHLLRTIFRGVARPEIVKNPTEKFTPKHNVIIASGWKPGCSTDYDAVLIAKNFGAKTIINLTNIEQVCDKDPNKYRDAKPVDKITWSEFRKLVGNKWDPGLNVPFDPVASMEAQKLGLRVTIMNGKKLENLENFLKGRPFKGTVIY